MPFDKADKEFLEECINKRVTPISSSVVSVEARLAELEAKLAATDIIVKAQEARISAQDVLISAQQSKLQQLESRLNTEIEVNKSFRSLVKKLETDIDDLEQYGRRYCARVFGIQVKPDETEEELFVSEDIDKPKP